MPERREGTHETTLKGHTRREAVSRREGTSLVHSPERVAATSAASGERREKPADSREAAAASNGTRRARARPSAHRARRGSEPANQYAGSFRGEAGRRRGEPRRSEAPWAARTFEETSKHSS